MKHALIVITLLALSACASFTPGTNVAPGFPNGPFELSKKADAPQSRVALNAVANRAKL